MPYPGQFISAEDIDETSAFLDTVDDAFDYVIPNANYAAGLSAITPVASTPTSLAVTGLSVSGSVFYGMVSSLSSAVGSAVIESSFASASATGITLWVYRTNTTSTTISWMVIGT